MSDKTLRACPLCGGDLKLTALDDNKVLATCTRCNFRVAGADPGAQVMARRSRKSSSARNYTRPQRRDVLERNPVKTLFALVIGFPILVMVSVFLVMEAGLPGLAVLGMVALVCLTWAFKKEGK